MPRLRSPALALLLATTSAPAAAQDVELLGRRHGTQPPASYYEELRRDPAAFEFFRGRSARLRLRTAPDAREPGGAAVGAALALGPRDGPVEGVFRVPVLLGLYSNSDPSPPVLPATIASAYFSGQPGSIDHYYDEVSGSLLDLVGDVGDWSRISATDSVITDGRSGLFAAPLGGGGAGNFVYELVAGQVGVDWGAYDNDGPDGVPNSGDDDGFVDVVAVLHPTEGGECRGAGSPYRIWSHRWSLTAAVGESFVTSAPRTGGEPGDRIRVDDYIIQPSVSCAGAGLNEIGVFTHELAHAFGLPDLYDTCDDARVCPGDEFSHDGVGVWDLMSMGTWGCDEASPESPCHLGAWSKEQLGWGDVVRLAADLDHGTLTLPPVQSTGTILRVDANDGSGEYFLLENRQGIGYDQRLRAEGLLVWHVDPDWVSSRWGANRVNANQHLGVWLRQADGRDDLGRAGGARGDAGDPFPGETGNRVFHATSNPAATSFLGGPTGVTLTDIDEAADDVRLRVSTRFTTLTLRATGASTASGLFTVDGAPVDPPGTSFASAPFVEHVVEATATASTAPGERRRFLEWSDAPAEPRARSMTTPLADAELVAAYGGTQFELALSTTGGVGGIEPASFTLTPHSADGWFDEGTPVTVEAVPLPGFEFLAWTGAFAGQPNPASVTMAGPVAAGADFELVYAVESTSVGMTATIDQDLQLEAQNGTAPYSWRVVGGDLPLGLRLSGTGRISGASLDLGTFAVAVQATDANGLPASATITFEVAAPVIPIEALVSPFLGSGPPLNGNQLAFLNHQGNGVSGYDVGDFRAWLLANPELPLAAILGEAGPRTIVVPLRFETGGETR